MTKGATWPIITPRELKSQLIRDRVAYSRSEVLPKPVVRDGLWHPVYTCVYRRWNGQRFEDRFGGTS